MELEQRVKTLELIAMCEKCPMWHTDECLITNFAGVPDNCPHREEYEEWSQAIVDKEGNEKCVNL
jgi:hypothetical protein